MFPFLRALALLPVLVQAPQPATGVRVSGRVVDGETGKPLAGAVVTLSNSGANATKRTTTAGANGSFEFVNVTRGQYRLEVSHPQPIVPYRSESLDLEISNRDLDSLGLILSPAISKVEIAGKLVMGDGSALPPAAILAVKFSGESVTTLRDGSFQLRLRPFEKYDVTLDNPPEGFYVTAVSGGTWDEVAGKWSFRNKPAAPVQVILERGQRRVAGRVLNGAGTPSPQAKVTLLGPGPSRTTREIAPGPGATFAFGGVRPGDYELTAKSGSGDGLRSSTLRFKIDAQDRANLELSLKSMSPIKGQILTPQSYALDELMRFKPYIEVADAAGARRVDIDSKGMFQFRAFEDDFTVAVTNLPWELRVSSVDKQPSAVTITLSRREGDGPDRVRDRR